MITVEEIIALGWRGQSKGSRAVLEERSVVLCIYIGMLGPVLEDECRLMQTAPINKALSQRRIDLALALDKLDKAINADKVINAELTRRGGRND